MDNLRKFGKSAPLDLEVSHPLIQKVPATTVSIRFRSLI